MLRRALTVLCVGVATVLAAGIPAEPTAEKDIVLDNGIRVTVIHVPGAKRQSTFTLLPLNLVNDAANRTQFSHLVEHMLIRSTDPDGLEVDGILINGETSSGSLRLETIAPPAKWRDALERHGKWLTASTFDAEVLEREKGRIDGEEESTIVRGFTGKWAEAAWNQVVRHGLTHAAAHGDVADASVEMVAEYVRARVKTGPMVRVVTVGPVAIDETLAAVRKVFGELPRMDPVTPKPTRPVESVLAVGDHEATWDLPIHHYLEWYPVPGESEADRVRAYVAAMAVNMRLWRETRLKALGFNGMAGELTTPEGRWIVFSGSVASAEAIPEVQEIVRKSIDALELGTANMTLLNLRTQFGALPDFEALRDSIGQRRGAEFFEAQVVLNLVMREEAFGMHRSKFGEAFAAVTGDQILETVRARLKKDRRSTLVLRPKP